MYQITEFFVAEGIVAQVLDDRASIGVGMRLFDLVFSQIRKAMQKQGRISDVQTRSTISSCVRTEYANEVPVDKSMRARAAAADTKSRLPFPDVIRSPFGQTTNRRRSSGERLHQGTYR